MENRKVRVRFAPSPTGPLHIGGVRTALFNYLFARSQGGDFLLRIEDTDQQRYVPGAEEYIVESLLWCGLKPDEGPGFGGGYGPYRQSERQSIYRKYAEQLLETGWAYYSFDTPEELDTARKEAEAVKQVFSYNYQTRRSLCNSISLDPDEVKKRIDSGYPYAIRFRMPEETDVVQDDLIRGRVVVNTRELDDKVLFKSDGMPTYHLANVVDDYLMEISHVIRGEEWLPSLPLHSLLYKAFGWEDRKPYFAHLPLILKPEGKGKLSKRDGDRLGFPVFPLEWKDPETGEISRGYREDGYFPEALVNLLALLGWNPGTEQEVFSIEQLVEAFSLDRVVKSGSRFNPEKAKWFNRYYLQQKSTRELTELFLQNSKNLVSTTTTREQVEPIVALVKERCEFVKDIWEHGSYFFTPPGEYDPKIVSKRWNNEIPAMLLEIAALFAEIPEWEPHLIKEHFSAFVTNKGWNFGTIMNTLRLCLVGGSMGPDLFVILKILGRDESVGRIKKAVETITV